jgi:catechol 2,3-dioxygenase-like lactoylglutathione lyase family enzyme
VLANCDLIAFAPTTDVARAEAFYSGILGLAVVERSPFACVVQANRTMLRLTPVDTMTPAPFAILGWSVPDIRETVQALARGGVELERYDGMGQDDTGVWTAPNGVLVAWFRDPDGNVLSITQFS